MAKRFDSAVSIILKTNGKIGLKEEEGGKFSNANVVELADTMLKLSKSRKAEIDGAHFWKAEGGTTPVLCWSRFGKPTVMILPARAQATTTAKVKKTEIKLA